MRWWGKGLGATFGWLAAGPWGAVLGTVLGNSADAAVTPGRRWRELGTSVSPVGWFPALFSVLGHLARADGRVSVSDIRFARGLMLRLRLDPRRRRIAARAYNRGRDPGFRPAPSLMRLRAAAFGDRRMAEGFLAVLVSGAAFGGRPAEPVLEVLRRSAVLLGVSPGELDAMLAEKGLGDRAPELGAAYAILGVAADATDREVKLAYRRLMHRHHPDRLGTTAAAGALEDAARRTVEIRRAWETVRAGRGIR